ncbi:MAG TPA: DUF134 domain-containing protein [Bacteroidales bacterium]|nr:DUF134 domain-containing protein [Bacteroidales bacterium]
MARLKRLRKILNPPSMKGFKPYGQESDTEEKEPVTLLYEEYEALRLCDYDNCNHAEASAIMNVSRPTFTRIYASLRQKLANAFVECRPIVVEGGKIYFDSDWHYCMKCHCNFNNPDKDRSIESCPLCGNQTFETHNSELETAFVMSGNCAEICVCPVCGEKVSREPGTACNQLVCSSCGAPLNRRAGYRRGSFKNQ